MNNADLAHQIVDQWQAYIGNAATILNTDKIDSWTHLQALIGSALDRQAKTIMQTINKQLISPTKSL